MSNKTHDNYHTDQTTPTIVICYYSKPWSKRVLIHNHTNHWPLENLTEDNIVPREFIVNISV